MKLNCVQQLLSLKILSYNFLTGELILVELFCCFCLIVKTCATGSLLRCVLVAQGLSYGGIQNVMLLSKTIPIVVCVSRKSRCHSSAVLELHNTCLETNHEYLLIKLSPTTDFFCCWHMAFYPANFYVRIFYKNYLFCPSSVLTPEANTIYKWLDMFSVKTDCP